MLAYERGTPTRRGGRGLLGPTRLVFDNDHHHRAPHTLPPPAGAPSHSFAFSPSRALSLSLPLSLSLSPSLSLSLLLTAPPPATQPRVSEISRTPSCTDCLGRGSPLSHQPSQLCITMIHEQNSEELEILTARHSGALGAILIFLAGGWSRRAPWLRLHHAPPALPHRSEVAVGCCPGRY